MNPHQSIALLVNLYKLMSLMGCKYVSIWQTPDIPTFLILRVIKLLADFLLFIEFVKLPNSSSFTTFFENHPEVHTEEVYDAMKSLTQPCSEMMSNCRLKKTVSQGAISEKKNSEFILISEHLHTMQWNFWRNCHWIRTLLYL